MFVGISDEWNDLFVTSTFHLIFCVSKRHCFERKTKIQFFENQFDTWMILVFRYRGYSFIPIFWCLAV